MPTNRRKAPLAVFATAAALAGCDRAAPPIPEVQWRAETVPAPSAEDAADDPAIWTGGGDPSRARILGTEKRTGLYVYGLDGALLQSLPVGPVNNVDLRESVGGDADIAVATHDGRNVVLIFRIDRATGEVSSAGEFPAGRIEPYGVCLGVDGGSLVAYITYKDGTIDAHRFSPGGAGADAKLERTVKLASQLEGCVVDEAQRRLFVGEEAVGLWSLDLADAASAPLAVANVGDAPAGLAADVEGVALWRGPGDAGYLVVSAQGASRFVVYDRAPPHSLLGAFRIVDGRGADPVTGTDGVDVVSASLGDAFPQGLVVVQDDVNEAPPANQNFKLVDWRDVAEALALK